MLLLVSWPCPKTRCVVRVPAALSTESEKHIAIAFRLA
jgi:hypothetical protein